MPSVTSQTGLAFRVEVTFDGAAVVVSILGEVDLATAPTLQALLRSLVEGDHRPIVLDLSRLAFMDASGLQVLADVSGRLAPSHGELVVRSAPLATLRILGITGVDDLVTIEADADLLAVIVPPTSANFAVGVEDLDQGELAIDLANAMERRASRQVLDAALGVVTTLTGAAIDGADGVSVTLERAGKMTTVASTNTTIRRMDDHQYTTGQGPCLSAAAEGRTFLASPLASEWRWPAFVPRALQEGIGSILSTPLVVDGRPLGALNVYSNSATSFGAHQQHLAALFADQASGLLAGADAPSADNDDQLASQVRTALTTRETIAQAQGVYMAREGISPIMAALTLHRAARAANASVLATAQALVGSTHSADRLVGQRPEGV